MQKRIVILFLILSLSLCVMSLRILSVDAGDYAKTASYSNSKSILITESRGTIYDCNLEPIVNTQDEYAIAVKPTARGLDSVAAYVGSERLSILRDELSKGNPGLVRVPGEVSSGKDIKVVAYKRRYADRQYATHLIGYLDTEGQGVTGLEKSYNAYLSENTGALRAAFYVDARGRNLGGADIDILDDGYSTQRGVVLSIDLKIQKAIEEAIDQYAWDSGCAVAMDPNTGEIKAMVSRPDYNQYNISESMKAKNSPLVNKALEAYSVGSTFKVIVSAAALEEDMAYEDSLYTCTGVTKAGNQDFSCYEKTVHGEISMQDALTHSCNTYFIDIARKLGATKIVDTAGKLGFGKKFVLADGIVSKSGNLPLATEFDSPASVANLGFGQGKLLATPLQLATAYSAVANGGIYVEPWLFKGYIDDSGNFSQNYNTGNKKRVLTPSTCSRLRALLTVSVEENAKAKPEKVTAAGKTATAQTGQYIGGKEICHSWFAGWYPAENPKLVIVIMKERGNTGSSDCAPVFKNIVDSLTTHSN